MRRIQYCKPANEAFQDLVRAMRQIGDVSTVSPLTHTVTGSVDVVGNWRTGWCIANVQASVIEMGNESCLLEVEAVAGTGAVEVPEVFPMLIQALEHPKDITATAAPKSSVSGTPRWVVSLMVLFVVLIMIGLFF